MLKAGLRRLWRDESTLQIGVDPRRAIVITGLPGKASRVLDALDGTRDHDELLRDAGAHGVAPEVAERMLELLRRGNVLDDADATGRLRALRADDHERLRPDLASIGLIWGADDAGTAALARRRRAAVRVHGGGRVGATVACLLGSAGIGHVSVTDPGPARYADIAPGGLTRNDVGRSRGNATIDALGRAAPGTRTRPAPSPDIVVLAAPGPLDPSVPSALVRERVPHLFACVRETTAIVGPFVRPGESSCLRCLDLHRTDRDASWPRIAAQLAGPPQGVEACDVVLATAAACHAAFQILAHIDGADCTTVDGTLELTLPDWRWRRRSWSQHPGCACRVGPES